MLKKGDRQKNQIYNVKELRHRVEVILNIALKITLLELANEGLVKRVQYDEMPPKVEYSLIEKGKSLSSVLEGMVTWANKYNSNIYSLEELKQLIFFSKLKETERA